MEERNGRMAPRNQLIACVIRQYGTGLYRAWVSLDKSHTVCLGAHQDEANATEMINRFLETYQEGQIKTLEDILLFIDSISSVYSVSKTAAPAEHGLFQPPSPRTA